MCSTTYLCQHHLFRAPSKKRTFCAILHIYHCNAYFSCSLYLQVLRAIISSLKRKTTLKQRPMPLLLSQIENQELDVDDDCRFTWSEKPNKAFRTLTQLPPRIDHVDILEGDLLGQPITIDASNSRQTDAIKDPMHSLALEQSSREKSEQSTGGMDVITEDVGNQGHVLPVREEAESREVENLL
jgi:hypothetical protein